MKNIQEDTPMTAEELKQIRLYRQHLTDLADKQTVVKDLCGVQCQFLPNAYHSLKIRCADDLDPETWGDGLVKKWTLRGTVHVISENDLPLFGYGNSTYKSTEWETTMCGDSVWISAERKKYFAELIINLISSGINEREALHEKCRGAGMTDVEESYIFNGWGGLFRPLCGRGFLHYKVQEKKAFALSPEYVPMDKDAAKREMMRRYLTHIAPATIRDISYFFGYPQRDVKKILESLPVKSIAVDGSEHFYMEDLLPDYPDIPDCILLAGFDQLMLGYQKTDSVFLLPEYLRGIFNLAGIVLPAVLLNGTVAGKWRRKGKKLEITCFRRFAKKEMKSVEDLAAKLWSDKISVVYM